MLARMLFVDLLITVRFRSWLDILKRIVLIGFIWFTLAIVFLAGTNRVNLFSLGYLIGSFIFLWQGNDYYLRPVNVILKWYRVHNYYVRTAHLYYSYFYTFIQVE